jgi:FAD/FMN-containing dehydrogenase
VRGGGHDWAGRALADKGLGIDMSRMRRVDVDGAAHIATVSGGATAADAVDASELHGLVPATGNFGQVGMAGLTLGGGYGPLNGVVGLALDNLLGADVVLPDDASSPPKPSVSPSCAGQPAAAAETSAWSPRCGCGCIRSRRWWRA